MRRGTSEIMGTRALVKVRREIMEEGSMIKVFPVITRLEPMLFQSVRFAGREIILHLFATGGRGVLISQLQLFVVNFLGKEGILLWTVIACQTTHFKDLNHILLIQ